MRLKCIPECEVDIAANVGQPAGGVFDPEAQDEVDATITKAGDMTDRHFGEAQHTVDGLRSFNSDFANKDPQTTPTFSIYT